MGYYDGMSMDSDTASSYDVSWTLGLPVILVLPCRGASLSLAAVIKGMVEYRPDSRIRGILLNRVSGMLYPRLKEMLERELKAMGHEIPVVGYVPEDEAFVLESRHLGLVTPQEMEGLKGQLSRAGEILSRTVDLDLVLRIAEEGAGPDISGGAASGGEEKDSGGHSGAGGSGEEELLCELEDPGAEDEKNDGALRERAGAPLYHQRKCVRHGDAPPLPLLPAGGGQRQLSSGEQ